MAEIKDTITFKQPRITYLAGDPDPYIILGLETRFIPAARQWIRVARAQQKVPGKADFVTVRDLEILAKLAKVVDPSTEGGCS